MAHQPQQLVATAISTTEITLSWTDVDTLEDETYDIERDSVVVEEGWAGGTTYTDTGLDPDTEYTYRVRAVGGTEGTAITPVAVVATAAIPAPTITATSPNADVTPSTVTTASVVLTPTIDVTSFDPSTISGLVAWYDFSDISTLWQDTARTTAITTDAQMIKGVTDLSGTAHHLSESTAGPDYKTAIQNSRSVSRYYDTGSRLSVTGLTAPSAGWTLFFVFDKRSFAVGSNQFVVNLGTGSSPAFYTNTATHATGMNYYAGQGSVEVANVISNPDSWGIRAARANSISSLDVYNAGGTPVNLNPADTVLTGATHMFFNTESGLSSFGDYDIAEVLFYDSALSASDMNDVGDYLAGRWNLTWTAVS